MGFTIRPDEVEAVSLDTIRKLDEETFVAWRELFRQIVRDCDDRPLEKKGRKVHLVLELAPVVDEGGRPKSSDMILGQFHMKADVPPYKSDVLSLRSQQNGDALFRTSNPLDFDQPGLPLTYPDAEGADNNPSPTEPEEGEGS